MKKLFLLFALLLTATVSVEAKKDKPAVPESYEISGAGAANSGSQLVNVSVRGKKADKVTDEMLTSAAVHGVLFKGFSDGTNSGFGTSSRHPAIMGSPAAYTEHIDYFEPFFKDKVYQGYVEIVDDTRRVVKSGKEYKVSVQVRVANTQLRKDLEKQGLVKSLKSGW